MQTNKQQITSFPFLGINSKDYKTTSFDLEVTKGNSLNELYFEAKYSIDNLEVQNLVNDKHVFVVIELTCQSVGLHISKVVPEDAKHIKFVVKNMAVDKNISFIGYLIAADDFDFSCADFSKAWGEESYFIQKDNVIGMTPKITIPINHKKVGAKSSIFSFQEQLNMDDLAAIQYELKQENILFKMPHSVYRNYLKIQKRKPEIVLTSLIVPVLTDILRRMKEDPMTDTKNEFNSLHEDEKWYQVIEDKFNLIFKEEPQDSDIDPFKAAQLLVKSPVYGLFLQTRNIINREELE